MALEGLQAALQRIDEIRSRFEPASSAHIPAKDEPGISFDGLLNEALGQHSDSASAVPAALESLIQDQATQQGLDADLLKAVIRNESGFNPKARSPVGAEGLMQLMPGTARGLGVTDSFDPAQNIAGGAKYLKNLMNKYNQSVPMALAAYNAGPGAVDRHHGIPPYAETTAYVKKVMGSYQAYQAQGATSMAQRVGIGGLE